MNFKSRNLIIIIGNGFDLAHNLPTSYNEFANHIIKDIIVPNIIDRGNLPIHSLIKKGVFEKLEYNKLFGVKVNDQDLQRLIVQYQRDNNSKNFIDLLFENTNVIKELISNKFLGKLFANQYENWFDIEQAYFTELINIFQKSKDSKSSKFNESEKKEIYELNENLKEIKELLVKYLKNINTKTRIAELFFEDLNDTLESYCNDRFKDENTKAILEGRKKVLPNFYIVNFNYTNTIQSYFPTLPAKLNYVHGSLYNKDLIFGYGNDKHRKYGEIKDSGEDEYLKYFKTFEYTNNQNYSNVYREALDFFNDYDVAILGHSLGQTDKTLLKEILDNPKCQRIHLYKRSDLNDDKEEQKKSFVTLVYALGRIIDRDSDLRKKLLNYQDSCSFPY